MTIYELDTTRPEGGEKENSTPTAPQYRGGEKIAMTVLATAYKNPPLVFTASVIAEARRCVSADGESETGAASSSRGK